MGAEVSFPVKAQACQTEHTAHSDAEVKEGSRNCSVVVCLHGMYMFNFTCTSSCLQVVDLGATAKLLGLVFLYFKFFSLYFRLAHHANQIFCFLKSFVHP